MSWLVLIITVLPDNDASIYEGVRIVIITSYLSLLNIWMIKKKIAFNTKADLHEMIIQLQLGRKLFYSLY